VLPPLLANKPPGAILFFAPELILLRYLAALSQAEVITTDYYSNDVDFPGEDIQQLSFADQSFALLLCNHVLEHVPDDQAALRECARVLVPGGVAVITVPGDFPTATTWYFDKPDDNGHFRHYGMDIVQKMRAAFDTVEWVDMTRKADPQWHIRKGDFAFICRK
jgi:predicted SAM-dependent methyltransferase